MLRKFALALIGFPMLCFVMVHYGGLDFGFLTFFAEQRAFFMAAGVGLLAFGFIKNAYWLLGIVMLVYLVLRYVQWAGVF